MKTIFGIALSFLIGLFLGSFFHFVGVRAPKKESLFHSSPHCQECGHPLSPKDMIPIVSYLLLKGKCRYCYARNSLLKPVVELGTALLFMVAFLAKGFSGEFILACALISLLAIVFVSDIRYMMIPNRVLLVFVLILLPIRIFAVPYFDSWQLLTGAATGFIIPFFTAVLSRGKMGGGDIKLFTVIGLALGWEGVLLSFVFSTLYGALIGIIGLLTRKVMKGQPFPFGPAIALGTLTTFFFGASFLRWYFQL